MDPAVVIALGVFVLTQGATTARNWRGQAVRERAVLRVVADEYAARRREATELEEILKRELENLEEERQRMNPLEPLDNAAWDLLRSNPPRALLADPGVFERARKAAALTAKINIHISSRETYRWPLPGAEGPPSQDKLWRYNQVLGGYDKAILTLLGKLWPLLDELVPEFERLALPAARRRLEARKVKRLGESSRPSGRREEEGSG